MKPPLLTTNRLVLKQFDIADAPDVFEYASNPVVSKWVTFETHRSVENAVGFIKYLESKEGDDFTWAIRCRDNPKVIGAIDFALISESAADIHYCLSEKYWNKGIMTEATDCVLAWGIGKYQKIERVMTSPATVNIGSCRVLEKCGFRANKNGYEKWEKYPEPVQVTQYVLDVGVDGKYRNPYKDFAFLDPGVLCDGDLELRLIRTILHPPESNLAPEYNFGMDLSDGTKDIGGINIRMGNTNSLRMYRGQIGYSVNEEHRGHHFAARSVALVLPLFRKHGFKHVYVTCNPDNLASIRSLELAGGEFIEHVEVPPEEPPYQRGEKQKNRYLFNI